MSSSAISQLDRIPPSGLFVRPCSIRSARFVILLFALDEGDTWVTGARGDARGGGAISRWVDHVPERYEVRVRYAGAYATRRRVWWRRRGVELAASPAAETMMPEPAGEWPALRARRRRWAELLRLVFQVEVEVCPRCGAEARIVGFVTQPAVIRRILAHLARRGVEPRAGPWVGTAAAPG